LVVAFSKGVLLFGLGISFTFVERSESDGLLLAKHRLKRGNLSSELLAKHGLKRVTYVWRFANFELFFYSIKPILLKNKTSGLFFDDTWFRVLFRIA
jgi:hypothetical protein